MELQQRSGDLELERWNGCGDCRFFDTTIPLHQYFGRARMEEALADNGGCRRGSQLSDESEGQYSVNYFSVIHSRIPECGPPSEWCLLVCIFNGHVSWRVEVRIRTRPP
jgi:hypothetical protein